MKIIISLIAIMVVIFTGMLVKSTTCFADDYQYEWERGLYPDNFQTQAEYELEHRVYIAPSVVIEPPFEQQYEWERGLYNR